MITTTQAAANLNWVIILTCLAIILFIGVLHKGRSTASFRLFILALLADIGGIIFFLFGEYLAIGYVGFLLIFRLLTGRRVR